MREGYAEHIYYKIIGEGEPILFISGLGADNQTWNSVTSILSKEFQCITIDNRGIGRSKIPNNEPCTLEKMADDINLVLSELNITKCNLIGHSLGGYVAQIVTSRHSEKIRNLVLIATKTKTKGVQSLYQTTLLRMMKENISREIIVRNSMCWLFSNAFLEDSRLLNNAIKAALDKPQDASRVSYYYQVEAVLNFDLTSYSKSINIPTLIIAGEQDMLVPPQDTMELHGLIQHSRLHLIQGMGHLPHLEAPNEVADLILKSCSNR